MNRERLTILRDHLASLPDERVKMEVCREERDCGTVACIMGWAWTLWEQYGAQVSLALTSAQADRLFMPPEYEDGRYTRSDAIAAIQSMLDSPDDDALPVWPERAEAA